MYWKSEDLWPREEISTASSPKMLALMIAPIRRPKAANMIWTVVRGPTYAPVRINIDVCNDARYLKNRLS